MLLKAALSKLQRYKLSPKYPGYALSEEHQCYATIKDSDNISCWIMSVNSCLRTCCYEGQAHTQIEVDVTRIEGITVHNNQHTFEYKNLIQFYFFDNRLCRSIRVRSRTIHKMWSKIRAYFVKCNTSHDRVRHEIIRYQNGYSEKGIRCNCVSAEALAQFTHPWLFDIKPQHPKCDQLAGTYRVAMGRLASMGELSGGGDNGLNTLPSDVRGALRTSEETNQKATLRHRQSIIVPILTSVLLIIFSKI